MARKFTNEPAYMKVTGAALATVPMTVACWAKCDARTSGSSNFFSFGHTGSNENYVRLYQLGAGGARFAIRAQSVTDKVSSASNTSTAWQHLVGTSNSSWQPLLYVNGVAATRDTTNTTAPSGLDATGFGIVTRPATIFSTDAGHGAWLALWNIELSADEIGTLARGVSPLRVRPTALTAFWPLLGTSTGNEVDVIGGKIYVPTGTVSATESYPGMAQGAVFPGFTPDTGTSIPVFQHHYQQMRSS